MPTIHGIFLNSPPVNKLRTFLISAFTHAGHIGSKGSIMGVPPQRLYELGTPATMFLIGWWKPQTSGWMFAFAVAFSIRMKGIFTAAPLGPPGWLPTGKKAGCA